MNQKQRAEPKIKYYDDMENLMGLKGSALVYLNEIHIDSKFRGTEEGEQIIIHEKKHIERLRRIDEGKNRTLLFFKDSLWDFLDCIRLDLKYGSLLSRISNAVLLFIVFGIIPLIVVLTYVGVI